MKHSMAPLCCVLFFPATRPSPGNIARFAIPRYLGRERKRSGVCSPPGRLIMSSHRDLEAPDRVKESDSMERRRFLKVTAAASNTSATDWHLMHPDLR